MAHLVSFSYSTSQFLKLLAVLVGLMFAVKVSTNRAFETTMATVIPERYAGLANVVNYATLKMVRKRDAYKHFVHAPFDTKRGPALIHLAASRADMFSGVDVGNNVEQVAKLNPSRLVVLYGPEMMRDYVQDNAPSLLPAFDASPAFGVKLQVWKFAALAKDGGTFLDGHVHTMRSIDEWHGRFVDAEQPAMHVIVGQSATSGGSSATGSMVLEDLGVVDWMVHVDDPGHALFELATRKIEQGMDVKLTDDDAGFTYDRSFAQQLLLGKFWTNAVQEYLRSMPSISNTLVAADANERLGDVGVLGSQALGRSSGGHGDSVLLRYANPHQDEL